MKVTFFLLSKCFFDL